MAITYAIGFALGVLLYLLAARTFLRATASWHRLTRVLVGAGLGLILIVLVNYTQVMPRLAMRVHVLLNLDGKHG